MEVMLKVKDLTYGYESGLVFDNLSENFGTGVTWVQGHNGAGKSTLLKLVGGALRPSSGEVCLGELNVVSDALAYRQNTFLYAADLPQFSWMTARELVEFYLSLYSKTEPSEVECHLKAFKALELLEQPLSALSMGQQRKVMLSIALAVSCPLLLLDEPFNALDQAAIDYLRMCLSTPERLSRQIILLTSHMEPGVPAQRSLTLGCAL